MMTVLSLWLPILIAAVIVFIASSVIHMMLGFHKNDMRAIPDERRVADALRPFAIPPGDYAMPHGHAKEMATPEFIQKTKEGPVAIMTVLPNEPMAMGKSLVMWFGYSLVVGGVAAYVAGSTVESVRSTARCSGSSPRSASRGIRWASSRRHLVGTELGLHGAHHGGRAALRTAHRGRLRLAVAVTDAALLIAGKIRKHAYAIVTTLLTLLALAELYESHEQPLFVVVLLLGCVWAIASRIWLARKGRLHPGRLRGLRGRENRPHFLQVVGRASFLGGPGRRVRVGLPAVGGDYVPARRVDRRLPASGRSMLPGPAPNQRPGPPSSWRRAPWF